MAHRINSPSDRVRGLDDAGTLQDFWRWAFSDLCDDDLKGIFAEWLVHKLLGMESPRRISWANSDCITPEGVCIEVKATAYWQSWKVIGPDGKIYEKPLFEPPQSDSKIRFRGLTARDSASTADLRTERTLKSQIYVLAFQKERELERWNAMDVAQWEFYVLTARDLAGLGGRTVALSKLRPNFGPLPAAEFVKRAKQLIAEEAANAAY